MQICLCRQLKDHTWAEVCLPQSYPRINSATSQRVIQTTRFSMLSRKLNSLLFVHVLCGGFHLDSSFSLNFFFQCYFFFFFTTKISRSPKPLAKTPRLVQKSHQLLEALRSHFKRTYRDTKDRKREKGTKIYSISVLPSRMQPVQTCVSFKRPIV